MVIMVNKTYVSLIQISINQFYTAHLKQQLRPTSKRLLLRSKLISFPNFQQPLSPHFTQHGVDSMSKRAEVWVGS